VFEGSDADDPVILPTDNDYEASHESWSEWAVWIMPEIAL
jgi:hypothetical protein